MLVGDSPYLTEQATGHPFAGASGQLLDRILRRLGIDRFTLTITNSMLCSPPFLGFTDNPKRHPEALKALQQCEGYLQDTINKQQPKVIVCLGGVAMRQVIGVVADITQRHSYLHETVYGIPAIPTFHPSYLLQGKHKLEICLMFALRRAQEVADGSYRESRYNLLLDPPVDEGYRYLNDHLRADPNHRINLLMVDIETPESANLDEEDLEEKGLSYHIDRAGFSLDDHSGISFPFKQPYIDLLQAALSKADMVSEWADNHFDSKRLRAAGVTIPGKIISGMWCLQGRTKVRTWEGKTVKIADIVDNRIPEVLIGMDENGKQIPVKVINWHKTKVRNQRWLRINTDRLYSLWITPEHKVWVRGHGWKEAANVAIGDYIPIAQPGTDDLIHGTILGDANVQPKGLMQILHSVKQAEWFHAKRNHLNANWRPVKPSKLGTDGLQMCISVGKRWRRMFYPEGKKIFIEPPSDAAVAVWYCDDGSWNKWPPIINRSKTTKWKHGHGKATLAIEGFAPIYQDAILTWAMRRYGLDVSLYSAHRRNAQLAIKRTARDNFFTSIAPYIHPSMDYKLPVEYRGKYNGWLREMRPQWAMVESVSESKSGHWRNYRYCVTVDHPTHRFFTEGGLVSNCWHFYQSDLLKGLGFVAPFHYSGPPWKHLASSQPALYNCLDQCIGRACTVGSMDKLRAEGRLDRFMRHCVDADRIYVQMGSMGVMIDTEHQSKFIGRLKVEYDQKVDEIQPLIPDSIKPVKLWKKTPKDMTGVIELPLPSTIIDGKIAKEMIAAAKGTVTDREFKAAKKKINELRNPFRYKRVDKFNINSPNQMKDLIRSLGLKVPKDRDGETTGAKHLKRFSKYPIFHTILQAKQRGKLVSSYNWKVDDRGRVKTTYGFHPSTWRKSSRSYNLQVIPKRSDLADEFRRMIVAAPGHYFVTSDATSIEAVLVGYDAGSDGFIRLAKAGIHDWTAAAYHGQPISLNLPDDQLKAECKAAKKKWPRDHDTFKRIIYLSTYLGTPYRIYEEYPEEFETVTDAGKLQNFYFSTPPGKEVRQWQSKKMSMAHAKPHYLENHFQYRHYFYSVFKRDAETKEWLIDHDGDAKRAVAFIPQSDGSAIQTEVILRLAEGYDHMWDWLRLIIHDETVLEVPEDKVEMAATILHTEMTRPIPELPLKDGGLLAIGAETKYGRNLAAYNEETNPDGMKEMEVVSVIT